MTRAAQILSENPRRVRESWQGYALRILKCGMITAHNEGIHEAERIILNRQVHSKDVKLENELSNILIELHEMKVSRE